MDFFPSFSYLLAALLAAYCLHCIRIAFRPGLRKLPGPWSARFSRLYRLSLVAGSDGPRRYRDVHEAYGPMVRVGPNHVSVADPAEIPVIYGIKSKFVKVNRLFFRTRSSRGMPTGGKNMGTLLTVSKKTTTRTEFYNTMSPCVFTEREPLAHRNLKRPVAQLFGMTNMRNYEPYADECTAIFINAMRDLEDQPIELSVWVQWDAFDVIASMTFQHRFGFLEELRDITEEEIARYDTKEGARKGRTDFLAQLREKEAKDGKIPSPPPPGDTNATGEGIAGSDTTAASLRACFYYLVKTPRAHEKLGAEIDEAERREELSTYISYEQCLKLPYLFLLGQAVMKEAVRLHPGVALPLERYVPPEGATIGDVYLPGGTSVGITGPVVHMDKAVYGNDVEGFRPERWLGASPD
ncbi:hypothetical protein AYL99_05322 [Fonsecaea erecta]|uniref:Pisatin demethylase n=1 Tax=Fonsecaea erecta TaxID=1367422 RepID=A0A178ZKJ2_9EURO|nr:hypothetical protein AYL99_05322 [Fonsecaea erecta]OAP60320.1 hypothetical protein AYL99_05322 [Fonsecaea erecta]